MNIQELLTRFHETAVSPRKQMDRYLAEGRKIVLTAPVYTPEEIIHAMGMVPMGVWGADIQLNESKKYFPAFICSIVQSIVELGMKGAYQGASAIVIPSLCDSLKVAGENWKYAVPSIPFIPMTYPQNRKPVFGHAFTRAGYERVIADLEKATGEKFEEEKLTASIEVYNAHNAAMRALVPALAEHAEITNAQRSDIFKSAQFMRKEEHTELVNELIKALADTQAETGKLRIMTTGILADAPGLLEIFARDDFRDLYVENAVVEGIEHEYEFLVFVGDEIAQGDFFHNVNVLVTRVDVHVFTCDLVLLFPTVVTDKKTGHQSVFVAAGFEDGFVEVEKRGIGINGDFPEKLFRFVTEKYEFE